MPLFSFAVLVVSTVLVSAVGIPLAVRMARAHVWRRRAAPQVLIGDRTFSTNRFEPVDMGPDLMRWPSEVPRESTAIPNAPWPSETWDDPHFGRRSVPLPDDMGYPTRSEDADTTKKQKNKKKKKKRKPAASPSGQAEAQGRRQRPQAPPQAPRPAASSPAPRAKRPAPKPQPDAPRAPVAGPDLPNRQQLEDLVAELGLAGTVQALMRRTGWDFKQAAGWLARMRKGG